MTCPIRVAVRVEPAVLHSMLLGMMSADPEVQVVDEVSGAIPPDVMVLSDANPEDGAVPVAVLMNAPRSRVLMLSVDGRRAFLYELRPHRASLGELSQTSLLAALHGAARQIG